MVLSVRKVAICNISNEGVCSVFCNIDKGPCLYINIGKYSLCVSLPVLLHNSHPCPAHASCFPRLCDQGIRKPLPFVFRDEFPYTEMSTISFQSREPYAKFKVFITCSLRANADDLFTTNPDQFICIPVFMRVSMGLGSATDIKASLPPNFEILSHMTLHILFICSKDNSSSSL